MFNYAGRGRNPGNRKLADMFLMIIVFMKACCRFWNPSSGAERSDLG